MTDPKAIDISPEAVGERIKRLRRHDSVWTTADAAEGRKMHIDDALAKILGKKAAASITASQGRHWTVVAAMARATTDQDPRAIQIIRDYAAKQREDRA